MSIIRLFVEKRDEYAMEAKSLRDSLKKFLNIKQLDDLTILNRYDIEGATLEELTPSLHTVFSELPVDILHINEYPFIKTDKYFAVEYLPGQFDMRSDSAIKAVKVITNIESILIKSAKVYILRGDISDGDIAKIKSYLINKVDQREASSSLPTTLREKSIKIQDVKILDRFIDLDDDGLLKIIQSYNLSMSLDDMKFTFDYFKNKELRNPTETEIKILDTYWSDHCRHTTFNTIITDIKIADGRYKNLFDRELKKYKSLRKEIYADKLPSKPITLMDMATITAKNMIRLGLLDNLENSDENNACSIEIDVSLSGGNTEKWLLQFKNETHNHPTEIEPFGGAATCLGGAIRDPLSGRAYVYQAMRISGAGNPNERIDKTLAGKLPQIKITKEAARGYSSYGNQIGIATGYVKEYYHEKFLAKRMEVGAVIGAVKKDNVLRASPIKDDLIILLGGKTGRDGIGGATGSSKEQGVKSIDISSAEVQKGNAPEEHKLQRLFRKSEVSKLIKKANDFGAGGVSVAIGELASGVLINLNHVPKKYDGLNATELAVSESQERMAVVIDPCNLDRFMAEAEIENIEATVVAKVTDNNRLQMLYDDKLVVDIDRSFLDSAGADRYQDVILTTDIKLDYFDMDNYKKYRNFYDLVTHKLTDLNNCLQKGLVEMFDSTIGAGSVLTPFGGRYSLTETEAMVAKIPVLNDDTESVSIMSSGYNPILADESAFHSAYFAIVESVSKIVASGGMLKDIRLSFQEYFERLGYDNLKWGKPFSALLATLKIQNELGIAAIGGKDSMSGTYKDIQNNIEINVPPTLISFAVAPSNITRVISPEIKENERDIYLIKTEFDDDNLLDIKSYKETLNIIETLITDKKVRSIYTVKNGGIIEAVTKIALGNMFGVRFDDNLLLHELAYPYYGSFIVVVKNAVVFDNKDKFIHIGVTTDEEFLHLNDSDLLLRDIAKSSLEKLENVFPTEVNSEDIILPKRDYDKVFSPNIILNKIKPNIAMLTLSGNNCEYDTKTAFERAGSNEVTPFIFKDMSVVGSIESCKKFAEIIDSSQILAIPGGFSAGDEPDGSGKFFVSVFMNPLIKDAIHNLIYKRDGLVIGICNGFQALIKSGLLTKGYIEPVMEDEPTLTFNTIGRHISTFVRTRVASVKSPWLSMREVGEVDTVAISHGEGRFIANKKVIDTLFENGQVAFQYVDFNDNITMKYPFNPNGSAYAIEAITSIDGKVLGKMAHGERVGKGIHINNSYGNMDQQIFKAGVRYFT